MERIELGLIWLTITALLTIPISWAFWKAAFTSRYKLMQIASRLLMIMFIFAYISAFIHDIIYQFDTLVTVSNLVAIAINLFFYYKYRKRLSKQH